MEPWEIKEEIFEHPFTCMICGPTQSGKTCLLSKILEQNKQLIKPKIDKIIFCYGKWQPAYDL